MTESVPLIIDTDPGVDDAIAIMLAIASGIPVRALTTVYGNGSIEETTRNALVILDLLGVRIPIYQGASRPLSKTPRRAEAHGEGALGGFAMGQLSQWVEQESASSFLEDALEREAGLQIAALGPLTNIADLVKNSSHLLSRVSRLIIIGGVFGEPGNVTPFAEFNAFNDPDALGLVLESSCSKILIPINICRKVVFQREDFNILSRGKLREGVERIVDAYIGYYADQGFRGGVMYDLLAIAYALCPDLFSVAPQCVRIDVSNGPRRGMVWAVEGEAPNCLVVQEVDAARVSELFLGSLARLSRL